MNKRGNKNDISDNNNIPHYKTYRKDYRRGISVEGKKGYQRIDSELSNQVISFTMTKKMKEDFQSYCIKNNISQSEILREFIKTILSQNNE